MSARCCLSRTRAGPSTEPGAVTGPGTQWALSSTWRRELSQVQGPPSFIGTYFSLATAQLSIVAHTWNPQEEEAGSQEFRASLGYIAELEVGLHELLSPKQKAKQIHTKQ